jgi:hypothetical protein
LEFDEQIILHDNAPPRSAQLEQRVSAKHNIPQVRQPSYSPYVVASRDSFSFPKLSISKGKRSDEQETTEYNAMEQLLGSLEDESEAASGNGRSGATSRLH